MAPKRPSASPAGGDTPKRARKTYTLEQALTAANLFKCMDLLAQSMKILEENYPNIERSTAVISGVMEKITCYEVLLKEKQQKKKHLVMVATVVVMVVVVVVVVVLVMMILMVVVVVVVRGRP
ncbi:hypothetical protein E2C01_048037 [Portunus trituberculatus]|uniref:Uncharacterized protein n=1 Tax=Portunus trituberculatus TaxID=210409 RepID=A0A5B7G234_PORTR|nr:hypothetical protein [Portunus trituberculatus]